MQIRVPRNELFEQLPRSVRRALIGENIPEFFVFEVETFQVGKFPHEEELIKKYADLSKVCTATEWYMFCLLTQEEGKMVPYGILGAKNKSAAGNLANNVNVHMKGLRHKIRELGLPIAIFTERGGNVGHGGYILEKL